MPRSFDPPTGSPTLADHGFTASSTPEDVDALFSSLTDPQRRQLIRYVAANPEPYAVEELAQYLSTRDTGVTDDTPSKDPQQAATLRLHHHHLPRLAAAGILDVDRQTNTILPGEHFDVAMSLLEVVSPG